MFVLLLIWSRNKHSYSKEYINCTWLFCDVQWEEIGISAWQDMGRPVVTYITVKARGIHARTTFHTNLQHLQGFSTNKCYGEFNFQCIELSRALEWIRIWENIIVRVFKMLQLTIIMVMITYIVSFQSLKSEAFWG